MHVHRSRYVLRPLAFAQLVLGIVLMGVAIAVVKQSGFGLAPWDIFLDGIARQAGTDLGVVGTIVALPLLLAWFPLGERPGIGTIVNLAVCGPVVHAALDHTSAAEAMWLRVALLLVGLTLLAMGQGMYLALDVGAGPRDGIMTGLHRRFGWSIRRSRTTMEVCSLCLGYALGGSIGVGTVVIVLSIGPMVQVALGWFGYAGLPGSALGDGAARAQGPVQTPVK